MKIKICGITNIEDALLCEKSGADSLGFVFYKKSRRYISPEDAGRITNALSAFTTRVGVFVNESPEEINQIVNLAGVNLAQIYTLENKYDLAKICYPVINAFRIKAFFNYSALNRFRDNYLLLDSYSKTGFGGTGKKFDWSKIPLDLRDKIILAGGISENDLEEIFEFVSPFSIDVSSSLEMAPGKKDSEKVKSFFDKFNRLRFLC